MPENAATEPQTEKKIGLVSTLEDQEFLTGPSEFILISDDMEKTFIDSVAVNLKKYRDRRVEVEGVWNADKTIFLAENMLSLGQEEQIKETYQNSEFGMKFKYPSIWIIKEEKSANGSHKLIIAPYEVSELDLPNTDHIIIERTENASRLSAREWLGLNENYEPAEKTADKTDIAAGTDTTYQQSIVGIGQLEAVKKTYTDGKRVDFYVNRDTFIYRFTHNSLDDSDKDIYKNVFFDLVGSFEFIAFGASASAQSALSETTSESTSSQPTDSVSASELATASASDSPSESLAPLPPLPEDPTESLNKIRETFVDYINEHISELAPEEAVLGGTWHAIKIEFAAPEDEPENFNAIYVTYEDGHILKKILLSVPDREEPSKMTMAAYFDPGNTTDWEIIEGTDTAKSSEKTVVDENGEEEMKVRPGMTLINARSFGIKIQYPSNWYWSYLSDGYSFSNKPVSSSNALVRLTKDAENLPEDMENVCKETEKAKYCLSGSADYKEIMENMMETLQE